MRKFGRLAILPLILTPPVWAQTQILVRPPLPVPTLRDPMMQFAVQVDPPSSPIRFQPGSSIRTSPGEVIAHRYFYNDIEKTYFGYDIRLELDPYGPVRIAFYDLAIGVLDIIPGVIRGDPAAWKRIPVPPLPSSHAVQNGDTIPVEVWSDPSTGERLTDIIRIEPAQFPALRQAAQQIAQRTMMMSASRGMASRPIPTVSGDARQYSADDAEIHLVQARVTVDGEPRADVERPANVSGVLVWFYLPHHGRYILSLAPRAELGFVKAGEVRGGAITFTDGTDKFLLESPISSTTGDAPYFLYVLHDPDWEPTAKNQADRVQFGSVAPGELTLLQKK